MPSSDAWRRIGALLPLMGSADDQQVGRALDQIDAALADAGLSWAVFGEKVSKLGVTQSSAPDPRRAANGGKRVPSQWAVDREDVVKLFTHCFEHGAPNDFVEKFAASLHDWVVGQGRAISDRQREILHEKLDQLDL
jgi:hypothetical protein